QHLLALVVLEISDVLIGARGVAGAIKPCVVAGEINVPLVFKRGRRRDAASCRHCCRLMLPVHQVVRRPDETARDKEIVLTGKSPLPGISRRPRIPTIPAAPSLPEESTRCLRIRRETAASRCIGRRERTPRGRCRECGHPACPRLCSVPATGRRWPHSRGVPA